MVDASVFAIYQIFTRYAALNAYAIRITSSGRQELNMFDPREWSFECATNVNKLPETPFLPRLCVLPRVYDLASILRIGVSYKGSCD